MKTYFEFYDRSRYGDIRTIQPTDIAKGVYKVMGKSHFSRGNNEMYDFEGGPFLMVGEKFYHLGTIAAVMPVDSGHDGYCAVLVSVDYNEKSISEAMNWQEQNSGL